MVIFYCINNNKHFCFKWHSLHFAYLNSTCMKLTHEGFFLNYYSIHLFLMLTVLILI